jgi:prepilin-type N-terminal cleavage/methylation domain-containing protein
MNTGDKRGFTLVEMMIVAVVGAMVVGATYQILLSSQRAMTVQTAQVQGQQAVRAGLDILTSELREISRSEGDILNMAPNRVEVRAMRAFGSVCGVAATGSPILVQKVGRFFEDGDSIMVFADNNPDLVSDDTILPGLVSTIDKTQTCFGGEAAQLLTVPALAVAAALTDDTVRLGAPVRAFTRYTYGLYSVDGDDYLARKSGVTIAPLVGPLAPNGVSFTYVDSLGSVTTNPRAVSRIEVTLRSESSVLNQQGRPVAGSLSTAIYLRN